MQKGKLIVIEGGDGSGKATQSELLLNYLKDNNIPCAHFDFPDYSSFYGKMIATYLRGEYGTLTNISPYLVSLLFALDRQAHREEIVKLIDRGFLLIVNRYVGSNLAHQVSKLATEPEQNKLAEWIEDLEYSVNKLPREDVVIYLHVTSDVGISLTNGKAKRDYLKGKSVDIQESDTDYRKKTEQMYDKLSLDRPNWHVIECIEDNTIRAKKNIHQDILKVLRKLDII